MNKSVVLILAILFSAALLSFTVHGACSQSNICPYDDRGANSIDQYWISSYPRITSQCNGECMDCDKDSYTRNGAFTVEDCGVCFSGLCLSLSGMAYNEERSGTRNNDACSGENQVTKFFIDGAGMFKSDNTRSVTFLCPFGYKCVSGACLTSCSSDGDCQTGYACADGHCCRSGEAWNPSTKSCGGSVTPPGPGEGDTDSCKYFGTMEDCTYNDTSYTTTRPDCMWCPKPYVPGQPWVDARPGTTKGIGGAAYPFIIPGDPSPSERYGCFNVSRGNPFMCGGCGFSDEISGDDDYTTEYFCRGYNGGENSQYCHDLGGGNYGCVDAPSERANPSGSLWYTEMAGLKQANPYFYYTIEETVSGYRSISALFPDQATSTTVSPDMADEDATYCGLVGGMLDPVHGCCGGNKARIPGDSFCNAKLICDGLRWHDANDESTLGEIFRLPAEYFETPYPVVSIGGELSLCVDDDHYENFTALRSDPDNEETYGCVPGENDGEGGRDVALDYFCPAGTHYTGGNHVFPAEGSLCRSDHLAVLTEPFDATGQGYFFCAGEAGNDADMWGHAYLIDARKEFPFGPPEVNPDSSRCPSAVAEFSGLDQTYNTIQVIGCPGMVPVDMSIYSDEVYAGPLGSIDHRRAGVCLPKMTGYPIYDHYVNHFNYFRGDNSVIGNVSGHQYICSTDNTTTKAKSKAFVAICCGLSGCSDIPGTRTGGGKEFSYGQKLQTQSGTLYCREDGTWGKDLDGEKYQQSCRRAGFTATGKYCCSEQDDNTPSFNESYNDLWGTGACYKSTPQLNNRFLSYGGQDKSIAIINGSFIGCQAQDFRFGKSLPANNIVVSNPFQVWRPSDVAYSAKSQVALAVWNSNPQGGDSTGPNANPVGQFISSKGVLLGQNVVLGGTNSFNGGIKVVYDDKDDLFMVVWGAAVGTSPVSTYASIVRPDGTFVKRDIKVADNCNVGAHASSLGNIAYGAKAGMFFVPCVKGSVNTGDITGVFVLPDGSVGSEVRVSTDATKGSLPSAAISDQNVLVTWKSASGLHGRLVGFDGVPVSPAFLISADTSGTSGIVAFFNPLIGSYEAIIGDWTYTNKRVINLDGTFGAEHKVMSYSSTPRVGFSDVTFSLSRGSFFVVGEDPESGANHIYEIKADGTASQMLDTTKDSTTMSFVPSVTDVDGVPLTLMNREGVATVQFGAFAANSLTDWPNPGSGGQGTNTGRPLVDYRSVCSQMIMGSAGYYCAPSGLWQSTSNRNLTHRSDVPGPLLSYLKGITGNPGLAQTGCCQEGQCWDPKVNACINNQTDARHFYQVNDDQAYKCLNGEWLDVSANRKYTMDGCNTGFCPDPSMCLVNPSGSVLQNGNTSGNPQCIRSGQYIKDGICNSGVWTTRTSQVASKLASLAKSTDDYVITCQPADEAFFKLYNPGNVNTVCVLHLRPGTSSSQRIFGTTLNQDLVDVTPGVGYTYALEQSYYLAYPDIGATFSKSCTASTKDFQECIQAKGLSKDLLRVYYDDDYKMVVFSNSPVSGLTSTWGDALCSILPGWLGFFCSKPASLPASLNASFDRLYYARLSGKIVSGSSRIGCECATCVIEEKFKFTYEGVPRASGSVMIEGLIATNLTMTNTSSGFLLNIQDPSADSLVLWNRLALLRVPFG